MANVVVVGAQWGDEGKGKIVDWLSERADVIARFQGGHNAGHTLVIDGKVYKLHALPSGVVRGGKLSVIGNGVVLDPWHLISEIETVRAQGVEISPETLMIAENTQLILPIHGELDRAREEAASKGTEIGTTGRGIGPCYEDKANRCGIRFVDLLKTENFDEKVKAVCKEKNFYLTKYFNEDQVDPEEIIEKYIAYQQRLAPFVTDISVYISKGIKAGKHVLFEGAQGTHLDIDHGTYPFMTSSNTVSGNACSGAGVGPKQISGVVGIVKAYTTRVGAGPFPTELFDEIGDKIQRTGAEFGATTGRKRRCGWLDSVVANEAVRLNSITGLAGTKLDVLSGQSTIKIATSYEADGKKIKTMPSNIRTTEKVKPVYEEIPGWQEDISGARNIEDLPQQARDYIKRIEDITETPAAIISVGPARDETLLLKNPFA